MNKIASIILSRAPRKIRELTEAQAETLRAFVEYVFMKRIIETAKHPAAELKRNNVFDPNRSPGFFDEEHQRMMLTKCGDPLVELNKLIDWEIFRPRLLTLFKRKPDEKRRGRKPIDPVLMFKVLIIQRLYSISDDQIEFQIRDRASFQRFLGIFAGHGSPDAKTVWFFRERLSAENVVGDLFLAFDEQLLRHGFVARGGQMIDASFVEVPRQRNTREENETIKNGKVPDSWKSQPDKMAQKDVDARWTKKNEETFYGYKNHVNADVQSKFIRSYVVTPASVHDSQMFDDLLLPVAEGKKIFADSAYRSAEIERLLLDDDYQSKICERAYRGKKLTKKQEHKNHLRSKFRCRIEHVFGATFSKMHGRAHLLYIGIDRTTIAIGLSNLLYNLRRFVQYRTGRAKVRYARS